jgi:hypothetical protein
LTETPNTVGSWLTMMWTAMPARNPGEQQNAADQQGQDRSQRHVMRAPR